MRITTNVPGWNYRTSDRTVGVDIGFVDGCQDGRARAYMHRSEAIEQSPSTMSLLHPYD